MSQTHKSQWNKRHGLAPDASHSLPSLARHAGLPLPLLKDVYARGIGAHRTNPASVRIKGSFRKHPSAPISARLSAERWAFARVYAFLNKLEDPTIKLNHDTDLVPAFHIRPSTRKHKKYTAFFQDKRPAVHFGDSRYQQYKDKLLHFKHLDHRDPQRRANYYSRHGRSPKAFTAKWFAHHVLW